jgi:hypothetical protein
LSALAGSAVHRMMAANGSSRPDTFNCCKRRARRARDLARGFAGVAALDRLASLVGRELRRASKFHAACIGAHGLPPCGPRSARANSAKPPSTMSMRRPCSVVVSAHVSPSDRNPAPLPVTVARVLSRSRVDQSTRSGVNPCPHINARCTDAEALLEGATALREHTPLR